MIELEKSNTHVVVEIIDYKPHAVVSKTIIQKITGNITVSALAAGEKLAGKLSAFDKYIQVIDGAGEVIIDDKQYKLKSGEGIVIPANSKHNFVAHKKFKMISTTIKSGYEELS